MANIKNKLNFIPSYLELPKDGNNGVIKGDIVLKTEGKKEPTFVRAELTIAPEAKIVPFTKKGLARLQELGFFTNVPVKPVLGETSYRLTLDDNGHMIRMQYRYTKEQREAMREARIRKYIATYGCDDDEDELEFVDSTSILNLIEKGGLKI